VLKDRRTYEIMNAADVGAPWNPLVLGKHSGRHAVQRRCADLGFQLEGDELISVYRALMSIADDRKHLGDDDIIEVVTSVRTETRTVEGRTVETRTVETRTVETHIVDALEASSTPLSTMHESGYGHGV